jgi:ATP-dependent Clp protease protease subunit
MTAKMTPKINTSGHDAETIVELTLLNRSIHFLNGEIDEDNIKKAVQWILYENLQNQDTNKILTLYVNSTGGSLYDALALIDIMNASLRPIRTIAIGSIMSAAFLIFVSGSRGHRVVAKNCGIMCHQFSDSVDSKYHDIKSAVKEADYCNERMLSVLRNASGMNNTNIKKKLLNATDVYLTAEELIDLDLADKILDKRA